MFTDLPQITVAFNPQSQLTIEVSTMQTKAVKYLLTKG